MEISALYQIYLQHPAVLTDTRKLEKDCLYFALKGPNFDGNSFAIQSLEAGAAYAVVDDPRYAANDRCIVVDDVLQTLQQLAHFHRKQFHIPFIGITGSNGKTTTKELVTAVLRQRYRTYATRGNLNNHIGVPLTLLSIPGDAQMAIIEMGANHLHEIEGYCKIALPTHAVITNCGKAHIEGFGSEEGVRKGKGELYDFIRANKGVIFRNSDLPYLETMAHDIEQQVTYGSANAQYTGRPLTGNIFLDVAILTSGMETTIHSKLVGNYNFPNIMTAVAVGSHFGISTDAIKAAIEQYTPDNSRSQLVQLGSNQIILDAYNANPTSMKAAISNFAATAAAHKMLWIGAMKEMGSSEHQEHTALIDFIKTYDWEDVIIVGNEFKDIDHPYKWFEKAEEAAAYIQANKPAHTSVLIKGSRGSRMELLLEALKG